MSRIDLTLRLALACVVCAGSLATPASESPCGDVNRDGRVDILDLQSAVNGVLEQRNSNFVDVNSDGAVDILDLQRLLARTAEADAPANDPPSDTKPDATTPPAPRVPQPSSALPPAATFQISPRTDRPIPGRPWPDRDHAPTRTERYLFTLTPNAPPLFS